MKPDRHVIGLVPAAGEAHRIAPLPCSKEVFPTGFRTMDGGGRRVPRVACQHLLDAMRRAGVGKAFVVLREGKWDIPAYLQDGQAAGLSLAYLMMRRPLGVPFTLDQAYPFIGEDLVLFGFPDILFHPQDAFVRLLERQAATGAEVVLGLFPAHQPHTADMVEVDAAGRVRAIVIKPSQTALRQAWIIAVWKPAFTRFLHEYVEAVPEGQRRQYEARQRELFLGEVIQAALEGALRVEAVTFPEGRYLDIGTPDNLARVLQGDW